jgi:RNA polymerase sigma factor (sigma-70 family)
LNKGGKHMTLTEKETKAITSIARRFARKWSHVDIEDLSQHLNLWAYTNWKYLERWREEGEPGQGKLVTSLRREAGKYCVKETEQTIHNDIKSGNWYTVERVERALPYIWELTEWSKANSVASDSIAILTDIRSAFYSLKKDEQNLLTWKYRDDESYTEIGKRLNISDVWARKRVARATQWLTDALGGDPIIWIPEEHHTQPYDPDLFG